MKNKFIGSGIVFPIELTSDGRPPIISDIRLINQSIMTILNWPYAHRYFNERFGCRVFELLEEPNDDIAKTLLSHFITESLNIWEKRIKINNNGISILRFDNIKVEIKLKYMVNATKSEETFIFPFYKEIIY